MGSFTTPDLMQCTLDATPKPELASTLSTSILTSRKMRSESIQRGFTILGAQILKRATLVTWRITTSCPWVTNPPCLFLTTPAGSTFMTYQLEGPIFCPHREGWVFCSWLEPTILASIWRTGMDMFSKLRRLYMKMQGLWPRNHPHRGILTITKKQCTFRKKKKCVLNLLFAMSWFRE